MHPLPPAALEQVFTTAQTAQAFLDKPVSDELLRQVYDLAKWGPTAFNSTPARFVFIRTKEGKEKLKPFLMAGNVDKTMIAPVSVIVAHDLHFYEHLPKLFPFMDAKSVYAGNPGMSEVAAFRNGSLQGAYFMLAARSLGLSCGPMSGFDNAGLDKAFFPDGRYKSNFLCNLGYADVSKNYPRSARLDFSEASTLA